MIEQPVKLEMIRHAPGIYIARFWGILYFDRYKAALKKRTDFIDQFDDDKYVTIANLTDVIHLNRPTVEAVKIMGQHDPRSLGIVLVGGPRIARTVAIIANKITKKYHFRDSIEDAVKLAEEILQQSPALP